MLAAVQHEQQTLIHQTAILWSGKHRVTLWRPPLQEAMTSQTVPATMAGVGTQGHPGILLPQRQKVVLVMDLVESVRLMAINELVVIGHWRSFLQHATEQVLPRYHGRLVKSLGDGILADFDTAAEAVGAALCLQRFFEPINASLPEGQRLHLRAGMNATNVFVDERDIYGSGVNLAARVMSLAGVGETLVTASVRDNLTDQLNGQLEDVGDCYLKHIEQPVRVYRVGRASGQNALPAEKDYSAALLPGLAVIPFAAVNPESDPTMALGDALADDIICALSRTSNLRVISRLSTAPFRGGDGNLEAIRTLLRVAYVVSGTYGITGDKVTVRVQLCDAKDGQVQWGDVISSNVEDIFHGQDRVVPAVAANVGRAILQCELQRARLLPVPTLQAYTLYIGGITMLHRLSLRDFDSSRGLLSHLVYLCPRIAAPHAMLAKWHLLRAMQGWSSDPAEEGIRASECANRALDLEPDNALALAMHGILSAHFASDLQAARDFSLRATQSNPQEALGWLHLGAAKMWLEADLTDGDVNRAISLSPLDPGRFGFEVFAGYTNLILGKLGAAAAAARTSIRLNAGHPAAYRLLAISLWLAGDAEGARSAARNLLRVQPGFTVGAYARQYPGRNAPHAPVHLNALRASGVPL